MNLKEYINNPSGKGSSILGANKKLVQSDYEERFGKVMLRENGKFRCWLFSYNSDYIAHFKIPSEVVTNLYYDTVIHFKKPNGLAVFTDLFDYDIEVFSNDPSFVFTYANAFIKNKLFFNTLISKLSREAATKPAKERNPNGIVGYVKSIYFAYLYMKFLSLNKPHNWDGGISRFDKNALLNSVTSADRKIAQRIEKRPDKGLPAKKEKPKPSEKGKVFGSGNIKSSRARGAFARKAKAVDKTKRGGIVRTTAFAKTSKRVR